MALKKYSEKINQFYQDYYNEDTGKIVIPQHLWEIAWFIRALLKLCKIFFGPKVRTIIDKIIQAIDEIHNSVEFSNFAQKRMSNITDKIDC